MKQNNYMRIVALALICLMGHSVLAGDFNDAMNNIVPQLVGASSQPANTSAGGEWYINWAYNSPMGHTKGVLGPYASEQAAKNDAERAVRGNGRSFTYTIEHRGGSSSSSGGSGLAGGFGTGGGSPQQVLSQGLLGAAFGVMASSMNSSGPDNSQQIEQERQRRILEEIKSVEDANQRRKALGQAITLQRTAREAANQQTDEAMKSAMDDSWMLASLAKPKKNQPTAQEADNPNIVDLRETNSIGAVLQPDPGQPTNMGILAGGHMAPALLRRPDKNPAQVVTWSPPPTPKSSMNRKSHREYLQAAIKDDIDVYDELMEALADKYGMSSIKVKIDNCREIFKTLASRNETTLSQTFLIMNRMARGEYVSPEEASDLIQESGAKYKKDAKELRRKIFDSDIENLTADKDEDGGGNQ